MPFNCPHLHLHDYSGMRSEISLFKWNNLSNTHLKLVTWVHGTKYKKMYKCVTALRAYGLVSYARHIINLIISYAVQTHMYKIKKKQSWSLIPFRWYTYYALLRRHNTYSIITNMIAMMLVIYTMDNQVPINLNVAQYRDSVAKKDQHAIPILFISSYRFNNVKNNNSHVCRVRTFYKYLIKCIFLDYGTINS